MLQNHREMPSRHLSKEASRLEQMLKDAKQVLTAWGRDPAAPGAHEGVASIRNAIDALDWLHLAVEEGGVAQIEETLEQALQAIRRTRGYMDSLIVWLRARFLDNVGSPAKKRKSSQQDQETQQQQALPERHVGLPQQESRPLPQQDPRQLHHGLEQPPLHEHDRGQSSGSQDRGQIGESTPYDIVRAQQILQQIMPFAEQEVAQHLARAHSLLERWTTSLWGHPIQLVDSAPTEHEEQGTELLPTLPEPSGEITPASQAETIPFDDAHFADMDRGRPLHGAEHRHRKDRQRAPSHRRRRLHAAMASTNSSEGDSPG